MVRNDPIRSTSNIPNGLIIAILPILMNKADSDRIHELCSLIEMEQDKEKFLRLVKELNRILSSKQARLEEDGTVES